MRGPARYFDGETSARHDVVVEAAAQGVRAYDGQDNLLLEWSYDELEHLSAPERVLRLGRLRNPMLQRLEVEDAALAALIDERSEPVDRTGRIQSRARQSVIAWTVAATLSLILVSAFGLPMLVERLAPLVPWSFEHRAGLIVDAQVRATLDTGDRGDKAFECGDAPGEEAGRAALQRLTARLSQAAALPIPLQIAVVRRAEANAIALPGGHIYVFEGLIQRATTSDELAGVIAHEIGHVAGRDGTRSALQGAGLSFLFGMVLGDFTGGGVVVLAARKIMQSAYARHVESAADGYGVALMRKLGADARALGTMLERIGGAVEPGSTIFLDHPQTRDRIAAINAAAPPGPTTPLLSAADWNALRRICR